MNILFITNTRIGDAVLSSGVLHYLVNAYPSARFTVVCGQLPQSLFAATPRLARVIVLRKRRFDLHWWDLWREVKGTDWDVIVDLRRSFISYFLRARSRHVIGRADDEVHRVVHLSSVLKLASPVAPYIYLASRHDDAARRLVPGGPPVLALAPIAAAPQKTWPADHFAALAQDLLAGPCAGWRLALFGGPGDETKIAPIAAAFPAALRIFGAPDLLTVAAALKCCSAFIGNDSGLSHLAAAVGLPTLALFGPSDPVRYAPFGARYLQAPDQDILRLDVAQVVDAARRLLP